MVIYGGETKLSFTFDMTEVNSNKQAQVQVGQGQLVRRGHFVHKTDLVARTFGEVAYIIDACDMQLHVYNMTE